jgi:hypothetical protein
VDQLDPFSADSNLDAFALQFPSKALSPGCQSDIL